MPVAEYIRAIFLKKRKLAGAFFLLPLLIISACNGKKTEDSALTGYASKAPSSFVLKPGKKKHIDWDKIPVVNVLPQVRKIDLNTLPVQDLDLKVTPAAIPEKETKFDYRAIAAAKKLDIDALSAQKIKFKLFVLPQPRLFKSGALQVKNVNLALMGLNETEGLPKSIINILYQDHEGFLWVATRQHLYRFDGENLSLYLTTDANNFFTSIAEDISGNIWIGTFGSGIRVLDLKHGLSKQLTQEQGLPDNKVGKIITDNKQRIWVAFNSGDIGIIDEKAQTMKKLGGDERIAGRNSLVSMISPDGESIWVSTVNGLKIIDTKAKALRSLGKAQGLSSDTVLRLSYNEKTQSLVMPHPNGPIDILDCKTNTLHSLTPFHINQTFGIIALADNEGKLWVGSGKGVSIYDRVQHTVRTADAQSGLSGTFAQCFLQDDHQRIWVGTSTGLDVFADYKFGLQHIGTGFTATVIQDKDGLVWRGTVQGVDIIDLAKKQIRHLDKAHGLANDTVETIREINHELYICTNDGVDVIDSARATIYHLGSEEGLANKRIFSVAGDSDGRLWIGGDEDGLDIFDLRTAAVRHLGKARGLRDGHNIYDIATAPGGIIWVSTQFGGIEAIDTKAWTIQHFPFADGTKPLVVDNRGNLWVGSAKGVSVLDVPNNRELHFSSEQGIFGESISSLLKYKNSIYAANYQGVTQITPPEGDFHDYAKWQVRSFGESYGAAKLITSNSFCDAILNDGRYCSGDQGLNIFKIPDASAPQLPVYITGANILDRSQFFTDGSYFRSKNRDTIWTESGSNDEVAANPFDSGTDTHAATWDSVNAPYNTPRNLRLPHDYNFLQFHFNLLDPARADTSWYRYKLVGFDDHWTEGFNAVSSRNYFSLSPGDYRFEIQGRSATTPWGNIKKLSFTILPPWWTTWWAYVVYVLLFSGAVWLFTYIRSIQLIRDKRRLEDVIQQRTEEVTQQKEEIEAQRDSLEKMVDELKDAQSQLVQTEKLASLGELTAGIAHEIQNPLNFVNNFSEVSIELIGELKEEQQKPTRDFENEGDIINDLGQNLEKIRQHGKRAEGIVKTMLQHSRNNSADREPTDINALADEYMRLAYHALRAKDQFFNCAIVYDQHNRLPQINVVKQEIGRVVLNVFNNAFYAVYQKSKLGNTGYQPKVTLRTDFADKKIMIIVKDNGNGMPPHIVGKVMQPFFTTKPTGEGTGLGLSVSHDIIVKGYGGNITVDTKEGEYSEFTIEIPVEHRK